MRLMLIDDNVKRELKELAEFADANRIICTPERQEALAMGLIPPVGDDPRHVRYIKIGYKVVFSVEEYPDTVFGPVRHMSIGIDVPGRLPNIRAVNLVLPLLGYRNLVDSYDKSFYVDTEEDIATYCLETYDPNASLYETKNDQN